MKRTMWAKAGLTLAVALSLVVITGTAALAVPTGIFATDSTCTGQDVTVFQTKDDVYIDGNAIVPDGSYYVLVTEQPSNGGAVLGTSVGSANETPVVVQNGEFVQCYQLSSIVIRASDQTPGYDTSTSTTHAYRVCIAVLPNTVGHKCDGFKATGESDKANLHVRKFYDANANGTFDAGEPLLDGWMFRVRDNIDFIRLTPVDITVAPDDYIVTEFDPVESNWIHTTSTEVNVSVAGGNDKTLYFGNVCKGAGGGLTPGFWGNKNGQALFGSDDLAAMVGLNLVNANGSAFNPASYSVFNTWLKNRDAVNMSYQLAAHLAAMRLNVLNGFVADGALIFAPGATSANAAGFATVAAIIAEANAALGADGYTPSGDPNRSYQEALKNALDNANNNLTFAQSTPCKFSFNEA
jgi:hypothetical protein